MVPDLDRPKRVTPFHLRQKSCKPFVADAAHIEAEDLQGPVVPESVRHPPGPQVSEGVHAEGESAERGVGGKGPPDGATPLPCEVRVVRDQLREGTVDQEGL